ncbi:hypothetical protein B9J78_06370 [bacterium Unc6]|nr:hypothetical protein [bacterium Unc6]
MLLSLDSIRTGANNGEGISNRINKINKQNFCIYSIIKQYTGNINLEIRIYLVYYISVWTGYY